MSVLAARRRRTIGAGGLTGPIVTDNFTEASNTVIESHTPDLDVPGGGWVDLNGAFEVLGTGDYAYNTVDGEDDVALIDSTYLQITVKADLTLAKGSASNERWSGLAVCGDGVGLTYIAVRPQGNPAASNIRVIGFAAGVPTTLETHSTSLSLSDGSTLTIQIELDGNDINISFPGSADSGTYTTTLTGGDITTYRAADHTYAGIFDNSASAGPPRWDNFTIVGN